MYKATITLATPLIADDEDFVWTLELHSKQELHRLEKAFVNGLHTLVKLTEDRLDGKGEPLQDDGPRTTVTFEANFEKDGADYGGYKHRWPGQAPTAVQFLRGLVDGMMRETGHGNAKQRVPKGKGPK